MYKQAKKLLKETGELMIQIDGRTFELHIHNVTFLDDKQTIQIEGGTETYWLNGDEIQFMWIHKEIS